MKSDQVKKLKIPRQLATALACSSRHRKSVELLLYLKYYCDAGRYKNTKVNQVQYAKLAKISYNTYLTRMVHLEQMELVSVQDGMLYVASWEEITTYFKLPGKLRWYLIEPPQGKKRIEDILEVLAMRENQEQQQQAFKFYLTQNPEIKETIKHVVGSTHRDAVHNSQLTAFLEYFRGLGTDEAYALMFARADSNLSYQSLWDMFWYNSRGGFAYKKRKLAALGLITVVANREYLLTVHTTAKRRTCKFGKVHYDKRRKSPVLTLPDAILFNSLNTTIKAA